MGDLEGAEKYMLEAKQVRTQKRALNTSEGAGLLMSIGMVKFDQCKFEDALVHYMHAKDIFKETRTLLTPGPTIREGCPQRVLWRRKCQTC